MEKDSVIKIGSTHTICQDYAISGQVANTSYAMISDGCSSSYMSDYGSRIVLALAKQVLFGSEKQFPVWNNADIDLLLKECISIVIDLGVPKEVIDATLLLVQMNQDEILVKAWGDGLVFIKYEDMSCLYRIKCLPGIDGNVYPDYLSYLTSRSRTNTYFSSAAKEKMVSKYVLTGNDWSKIENFHVEDILVPVFSAFSLEIPTNCKYVIVMSDGMESFFRLKQTETDKRIENAQLGNIIQGISSFKSLKGQFVQRRVNMFLKEVAADGWQHYDDLAIAAVAK